MVMDGSIAFSLLIKESSISHNYQLAADSDRQRSDSFGNLYRNCDSILSKQSIIIILWTIISLKAIVCYHSTVAWQY